MLIALWIINGLLALLFLASGVMKVSRPREALASTGMTWAADYSDPSVKLIGAAEVIGALGLVLPILTGIAPVLSPIAALALAVIMIGAAVVHARRKEPFVMQIVIVLLCVASAILGFAAL